MPNDIRRRIDMNCFEIPLNDRIYDPTGRHDIEDPMHDAESVMRRIDIQPMPMLDGTY